MHQENKAKFQQALTDTFTELFKTPGYAMAAAKTTPALLAERMLKNIYGSEVTGEGFKQACKACGIKNTRKEITAFFNQV